MPLGLCLALRRRHLEAVRLRLASAKLGEMAVKLRLSYPFPAWWRLEQVLTRMERSNAILLRAFAHRRATQKFGFARELGEAYAGAVRYGDLDPFYWLSELMLKLVDRRFPERGTILRQEEEEMLEALHAGYSLAQYARAKNLDPQGSVKVLLFRYIRKLQDVAGNFSNLASASPEPHPIQSVKRLRKDAERFIALSSEPFELDAATAVAIALQMLWLTEVGMHKAEDRARMVRWLRTGVPAELEEIAERESLIIPERVIAVVEQIKRKGK